MPRCNAPTPPRRVPMALLACAGIVAASLAAASAASLDEPGRGPVALASVAGLGAGGAGGAGGSGGAGDAPVSPKSAVRDAELDLVKQRRVLAALSQAGIDAESLAAAGITPPQATAIAAAVAEQVESLGGDLETASAALLEREQQTDALERLLIAGQASQDQITQLDTARAGLAAARAARDTAVAAVWNAATAEITAEPLARLAHLRDTCHHQLPADLRSLQCTPGEFAALENAHAAVRVAAQLEMDPDPEAQALVSDARAQPAATAASGWLTANLAAVSSSLAAAAGQ